MITQVSCPACQFKSSIPEGDMGKRQVCSNCKSPFIAGASVPESRLGRNSPPGAAPAYQQTMLAGTAPPIKFNCPRCQAPLEAPSIEAGTKKPCSACGQRLQVPAAPPPPVAAAPPPPNLNKTMLTSDASVPAAAPIKYNCPACKKPLESPASEALTKKPCPACGQRLQVPAASPASSPRNPNRTMLASDANSPQPNGGQPGYAMPTASGAAPSAPAAAPAPTGGQITIGGYTMSTRNFVIAVAAAVFLLLFFGQAVVRGGKSEDVLAQQRELQKANEEFEQKKAKVEEHNKFVSEILAKLARQEDEVRERYRDLIRSTTDQRQRQELQDKQVTEEARLKRENEETKRKLDEEVARLKAEADKAQKTQQTIIQQPAPVMYYPPYHWRYYSPWGW